MSNILLYILLPIAISQPSTSLSDQQAQRRQDFVQYRADLEWLGFYAHFGNGPKLAQRLDQLPTGAWSSRTIHDLIVTSYAELIADKVGIDKAVGYIDKAMRNVPEVDHKVVAKQSYDRSKALQERVSAKPSRLTEAEALALWEQRSVEMQMGNKFRAIQRKADLLAFYGRPAAASETVDEFSKSVPAGSRLANDVDHYASQLNMIGKPFPTLAYKNVQGSFSGLDGLKGKVVVLQLVRDLGRNPWRERASKINDLYESLQGRGFEMVIVVDAKPYGSERLFMESITRDIRNHKISWSVIRGEEASEKRYKFGVLSQAIVLDRAGVVRFIQSEIGPRGDALKLLRARVERLLAEK